METKTNNDLIIRKQKIEWLKIINMCFNKLNWGKTYTLYTCKTATISCIMKEFNFEDKTAWFRLKLSYTHDGNKEYVTDIIRYVLDNFTLKDFKMHLNKKLLNLLNEAIEKETNYIATYKFKELRFYRFNIEEKDFLNSKYSTDYKSILKLKNVKLMEECLYDLKNILAKDLNKEFYFKVENYVEHNRLKIEGVTELYDLIEE